MPKTIFDQPKKTIIRKKIKDADEQQAQYWLRQRKKKQMEAAEDRAYKRRQGKRSR